MFDFQTTLIAAAVFATLASSDRLREHHFLHQNQTGTRHHQHNANGDSRRSSILQQLNDDEQNSKYVWKTTGFTECTSTCLGGTQDSIIQCVKLRPSAEPYVVSSYHCDLADKPSSITRTCNNHNPCPYQLMQDDASSDDMPVALPWMQHSSPSVSTDPTFIVGEWGECSALCGEGVRERAVECKILLEFSQTVAKLPDSECPGQKPASVMRCLKRPCSESKIKAGHKISTSAVIVGDESAQRSKALRSNNLPHTFSAASRALGDEQIAKYVWKTAGFSECTATCLGGTQESIIQCIKLRSSSEPLVVSPYLCDIVDKPDSITRTCNDIPCPPRWSVSEFGNCSKECGNGVQTRQVQCIHEVARGPENTLVVSHAHCPPPAPHSTQRCNVFECPARWEVSKWGKCSRHCGGGIKLRTGKCVRELSLGQVVEVPSTFCPNDVPPLKKACNKRSCKKGGLHGHNLMHSMILPTDNSVYVQKEPLRRLSIKVGGKAVVFAGTTLKIRCPRSKSANKTLKVDWFKDGNKISYSKKYQLTARHALRVKKVNFNDAGSYACALGNSEASIMVSVKPAPSDVDSPSSSHDDESPQSILTGNRLPHGSSWDNTVTSSTPKTTTTSTTTDSSNYYDNDNGKHLQFGSSSSTTNKNNNKVSFGSSVGGDSDTENQIKANSRDANTLSPVESGSSWDNNLGNNGVVRSRGSYYADHRPSTTSSIAPRGESSDLGNSVLLSHTYAPPFEKNSINSILYNSIDEQARSSAAHNQTPITQLHQFLSKLSRSFHYSTTTTSTTSSSSNYYQPAADQKQDELFIDDYNSLDNDDGDDSVDPQPNELSFHHEPLALVAESQVDNMLIKRTVLGKNNVDKLRFDWLTSDWSICSESCGVTGFQVRGIQCVVRFHNVTKPTEQSLCLDAGLRPPPHIRDCETQDCPKWIIQPWGSCDECVAESTAIQTRSVKCITSNGRELQFLHCDNASKPMDQRHCPNSTCKGTWMAGNWSECVGKCGQVGFQHRVIQCVWYGTQTSAGNACSEDERPLTHRECQNSCTLDDCTDRSKHCKLAIPLNMCRISHYRRECCQSCRHVVNIDSTTSIP